MFKFELHYAGVFRIENVPAEQVQPLAMIEGPRLLFPFARQIIADAVRNGGYPPLYVDPIDFHRLYLQRLQAASRGDGERLAALAVRGRRVAAPNRRFAKRVDERVVGVEFGLARALRQRRRPRALRHRDRPVAARRLDRREGQRALATAGQLAVDLDQNLGVEQRAVAHPLRAVDAIAVAQRVEIVGRAGVLAAREREACR